MKDCTQQQSWQDARKRTAITQQKKSIEFRKKYESDPKRCIGCNDAIKFKSRANKFCSRSCAATINNAKFPRRGLFEIVKIKNKYHKIFIKRPTTVICHGCGVEFNSDRWSRKYCSIGCRPKQTLLNIKLAIESGDTTQTHQQYRKYLIEKYGAKCMMCGWKELNIKSGKCPIELDHIDGNSENNKLENLRLLCPSCHSIQPTYKGLNKGHGRHSRRERYRLGKSF